MPDNFSQFSYSRSGYQSAGPINKQLTPGAGLADVVAFDVTALDRVTISFAVGAAALNGLDVWARGDTNSEWMPLALTQLPVVTYGRNDSGSDITTTPPGATGFVSVNTEGWSDIKIRASSAGAATMAINAGGK